jgi:digeranylgeranylglycerophospholipid reductase
MNDYDVLVIGAGPAGSTAAKAASEEGLNVLMIERKANVGLPVHCAGYIPRLLSKESEFDANAIIQKIDFMRTYLPDGETIDTRSPGFILERSLFDKHLALRAVDAGADLMIKSTAVSRHNGRVVVKSGRDIKEIGAKIIIGADGAKSTVGNWVNERNRDFILALQAEVRLKDPMAHTEVYFNLEFEGGYAWLFPRGLTANVGVGVNFKNGNRLRQKLEHFLESLDNAGKVVKTGIFGISAGLVPVGGYLNTVPDENVLLVGDAAGHTDPITGAGILTAIQCGKIAGKVAVEAIRNNDMKILKNYELEWKKLLQQLLDRAIYKRRTLDANWGSGDFKHILSKTWVAFGDYWRDE